MPNFAISDMAPATLPIDAASTFFEIEAIEGGVSVSRKIAASNLTFPGSITVEDEGVPLVTAADTLNFVGAGVTASGVGSTKTITIPESEGSFVGYGIWRYRTAITSTPGSGQVQFDNATINLATEVYVNVTNDDGTDMSAFLGLIDSGDLMYLQVQSDASQFIVVEVGVSSLLGSVYTFPITEIQSQGATPSNNTRVALVVSHSASGGGAGVVSVVGGINIDVDSADPANPIVNMPAAITGVSVNGVTLQNAGVATDFLNATGAYSAPAGGGQVDSVVGGTNISVNAADPVNPIVNLDAAITGVSVNGVTLSNAGAATNYLDETGAYSAPPAGAIPDPLIIGSINLTSALLVSSTGAPYDNVAINIGANLIGTQGMTQHGRQNIQAKASAFGFNSTLFININGAGTNGANTFIGGLNSASIEIDFGVAVRMQHGTASTVVAQTNTPAAGGFQVNNTLTGVGLERVLTASDLGGTPTQLEDSGGNIRVSAETFGVMQVRSVANLTTENRRIDFTFQNTDVQAHIGFNGSATFELYQRIHGENIQIGAEDAGGVLRLALVGDPDASTTLYNLGVASLRTADPAANDLSTGAEVRDTGGVFHPVGYNGMPPHLEAGGYIFRKEEVGKMVYSTEGALQVYNTNQETDVEAGATWGLAKPSGGSLTLAPGSGVTLRHFAPDGTITSVTFGGSFTLSVGFIGAVYKVTDIEYWFWGNDTVT